MKISAVIICKNEEALIARCLESVKQADEIIVCDTGSTDKTIEIAKTFTDKVFTDFTWCDDFAAARNHAKSKATGDWILSLDADEYLHDFSEVRKAVETAKDSIRVHLTAEGGGRLNFDFARLFRNSPDIYWVQPIHNHLNIPGAGEPIGDVTITFGWSPAHEKDPDRALRILEKIVSQEKEPVRNLYYLGREYWYKKRYQECTATLGRYVQVGYWQAERAEAFLIMSQAYSKLGLDDDARSACAQAIIINPNFKEAVLWMAGISKPENAEQWRQMAKTADNRDILFLRTSEEQITRTVFLSPHNDDETLFGAFTLLRIKPLVIICTDSFIQPNRGDSGCTAEIRRQETIEAMKILGCPVVFLGIKDTELTAENLKERLKNFHPDKVYAPAVQAGNPQHDIIGRVARELFSDVEAYTTYTKTELWTPGGWEIKPTEEELALKNKALDCYVSQIDLPATAPHFRAVRGKSEWLI